MGTKAALFRERDLLQRRKTIAMQEQDTMATPTPIAVIVLLDTGCVDDSPEVVEF